MEAALRVLRENPFSDEAVFAALALVAKHAKAEEFASLGQRQALFQAIGGANFFRRLLKTPGMEAIGLNILSPFCEDSFCAVAVRTEASNELLAACDAVLRERNNDALLDACKCLVALRNLPGTARFLLKIVSTSDQMKTVALNAFAVTCDAFFLDSDVNLALQIMETVPDSLIQVMDGMIARWQISRPSEASIDHTAISIEKLLRAKSLPRPMRVILIKLSLIVLLHDELVLSRNVKFALVLAATASVEVKVALPALVDGSLSSVDIDFALDSVKVLDKCASWFAFHSDVVSSEQDADAIMRQMTTTCESTCAYFASARTLSVSDLDTILTCFVCSVLTVFWVDDPVSASGLKHVAVLTKAVTVVPNMILRADSSALRYLCPLLVHIDADLWCQTNRRDEVIVKLRDGELLDSIRAGSVSRFVFSSIVIVLFEPSSAIRVDMDNSFRFENQLEELCVRGAKLLLSNESDDVKSFLERCDAWLKRQDVEDEDEGVLSLHWNDLRLIVNLVRMNCS